MAEHGSPPNPLGSEGKPSRNNSDDKLAVDASSSEFEAASSPVAEINGDLVARRPSPLGATSTGELGAGPRMRPPMMQSQLLGSHDYETVCGTKSRFGGGATFIWPAAVINADNSANCSAAIPPKRHRLCGIC